MPCRRRVGVLLSWSNKNLHLQFVWGLPSPEGPNSIKKVVGVEDVFGVVGGSAAARGQLGQLPKNSRGATQLKEIAGILGELDSLGRDAASLQLFGPELCPLVTGLVGVQGEQHLFDTLFVEELDVIRARLGRAHGDHVAKTGLVAGQGVEETFDEDEIGTVYSGPVDQCAEGA